jgi:hypothetical protein
MSTRPCRLVTGREKDACVGVPTFGKPSGVVRADGSDLAAVARLPVPTARAAFLSERELVVGCSRIAFVSHDGDAITVVEAGGTKAERVVGNKISAAASRPRRDRAVSPPRAFGEGS